MREGDVLDAVGYFWPGHPHTLGFGDDGLCSFCADTAAHLDRARLRRELDDFVGSLRGPVVLAYSGGKDSTAALHHLRVVLRVPVVALLFDNGFIPSAVKDYAAATCARLGATLIIDTAGEVQPQFRRGLARRLAVAFRGAAHDVCGLCSRTFLRRFHRQMRALGAHDLALGNNFWKHSPHTAPGVDPPWMTAVSHSTLDDGHPLRSINLPFAAGITYARTQEVLSELGFHGARFGGYTTNCLLSDVQDVVRARDGQRSDWGRQYLSLEVSAGYLQRDEALALASRDEGGYDLERIATLERAIAEGSAPPDL